MTVGPDPRPFVTAVILAAGSSTRMGRPKLALPVQGEPMIRRVARAALQSRCREVIVVLGAHAETYRPLLNGLDVRVIENPHHAEGMGTSIRAGTAAVSRASSGAIILLADQPFVDASVIDRLIESAATGGYMVVASAYQGTVGPPAYFDRSLFDELQQLTGDRGARAVIERHPERCLRIPLGADASRDIDAPADVSLL
ncbi:MAG: nucleotidyltransferase family protein [Armatimonadota bacterium]|nr:nucleotidyltransferase family protein [Armatimonadota bacterium]